MTPICNVCDSSEKIQVYDPSNKLYRCVQCDHTFTVIDEKYSEKNIYAEDYFDSAHKNWFLYPNFELFEYIRSEVIKHLNKHDFKLIDVGSGRGDLLSYLRKKEPSADLTGVDGAPCASPDFKFIQDDFMKVEFNEKFDVVTSLACIEHIDKSDLFVEKLKSMVSPEGLVIIMTINAGGMMYGIARILNRLGFHSPYNRLYSDHHIHHFTNQSLRLLLEKYGFKIIVQRNHNYSLASCDFPPAGPLMTFLYKSFTAVVFFLSTIFNNGISQTLVCVPNKS